ncbi:MAG: hypothetical protein KDK71_07100, partial [Chlamydiia bacterium]|nr:hypothetical protein [Chlamydiia bacterium]
TPNQGANVINIFHKLLDAGKVEMAKQTIERGLRLEDTNAIGQTPLEIAQTLNQTEIIQMIKQRSCAII